MTTWIVIMKTVLVEGETVVQKKIFKKNPHCVRVEEWKRAALTFSRCDRAANLWLNSHILNRWVGPIVPAIVDPTCSESQSFQTPTKG